MNVEERMKTEEEEEASEEKESLREDGQVAVDMKNEVEYFFDAAATRATVAYKKGGWGARHTLVLLACTGVILMSTVRYSLSIAIVSMVTRPAALHQPQHHRHSASAATNATSNAADATLAITTPFSDSPTTASSSSASDGGGGGGDACPAADDGGGGGDVSGTLSSMDNDSITRFEWDERAQGHVLGAFYYGYFLTNLLGGRLAEKMGSKPVILLGMLLSSLLCLVSPLAAHLSIGVFIGVRLILGCAQGVLLPAFNRCLVSWVPPFKRSKYNTFVFIGSEVGIVLSLAVGGYLCSQVSLGGWAAVFYVFGSAGVLWCVAWYLVAHNSPQDHGGISTEEQQYLEAHCVVQQNQGNVAWSRVLSSLPFWAVAVMHVGYNWGYYTFITELPVYLANMQHFTVRSNGIVSALPYVVETIFAMLFSLAVDRATRRGKLSVLAVRRLAMAVASYIPAAALVGMCLVGCDSVAAVVVVCVSVGAGGSAFCGLFSSHQDLAPHLAGTLFGATNSIANVTGFIAPALVGVLTYKNQTVWAWNTVFLLSAVIYLLSGTFYIVCITDQVQPFSQPAQVQDSGAVEKEGRRSTT